jgi:hypothetical protein
MADDELDQLYRTTPEDFTALRARLASAAKERGDTAGAKQISASRKPTTAAWIVNRLALEHPEARARLRDLGERLRAAHAAMDGDRIRELSAQQRNLIEDLARTGFAGADVPDPTAALRDDVTGTLQAAIADPDVAARLGRLARAERWSGFGEFGDTAQVFTAARSGTPKSEPARSARRSGVDEPDTGDVGTADTERDRARAERAEAGRAERERARAALTAAERAERERARAALTAAERAKSDADEALSELQADLAAARLRREDARRRLREAEANLHAAEDAYDQAKRASRQAGERVKGAKQDLGKLGR